MGGFSIAWSPLYDHPLGAGHRFPMEKYTLLKGQLLYEGIAEEKDFFEPQNLALEVFEGCHSKSYIDSLVQGSISPRAMRKIGFPYSPLLIEREINLCSGTVQCMERSLEDGISFNIAGGTHHAYADRGEGFCLFNDQALAASVFLNNNPKGRVLILDLDVHQGNGTASIFEHEARVTTVSLHGKNNYPLHKEKSDIDVELPDGTGDAEYLRQLESTLEKLQDQRFDIMLFQAGVDVLGSDKLGRLNLTLEGCKNRDARVFEFARARNLPVTVTMGGGYSANIKTIVQGHKQTFELVS